MPKGAAVELLVDVVEKVAAGVGLNPSCAPWSRRMRKATRSVVVRCAQAFPCGARGEPHAGYRLAGGNADARKLPVVIVSAQALNRSLSEVTVALFL